MDDLTGKQFGPYQIVGPLGEGGMAAVYKAYHPATERYVALKVLPRQLAKDPQFVSRFQREAKLLAQLQHPHILPVFDHGQAEGYTYIVMPFVTGGTLADDLKGEPLPLPKIRQVTTQIADALTYAHERGLIHRDIKPSNVLIDEGGNCLLTDFGLARMVEGSVNLTTSGTVMGTPAYMSPEQGSGQKIDSRTDIYSLGVILYQMATGRVPYHAETPVAVIFKHMNDPLPPPRMVNAQLPEEVELVILKALSKRVDDRFPTAKAMAMAIRQAIPETPPTTIRPAIPGRTWVSTAVTEAGSVAQGIQDEAPAARAGRRGWPVLMLGSMGVLGVAVVFVLVGRGLTGGSEVSPPVVIAAPVTATPRIAVLPALPTATPTADEDAIQGRSLDSLDLGGRMLGVALIENDFPVFSYVDATTGQPAGWAHDALGEICRRLDCVPDYTKLAWEQLAIAMDSGGFDAAVGSIAYTKDREEAWDLSEPFFTVSMRLLVRADTGIADVETYAADPRKVVGIASNTISELVAEARFPEERIVRFSRYRDAASALLTAEIDAVLIEDITGELFVNSYPAQLKMSAPLGTVDQYVLAFPSGSDLRDPFNQILRQMAADGTLDALNYRWFTPLTTSIGQ